MHIRIVLMLRIMSLTFAPQTFALISYFLCAMALHPDVQEKARRELEDVVGSHRLPDHGDSDSLPYIRAVFLESTRWMPTVPILERATSADDVYHGYFIPKGTLVVVVCLIVIPREDQCRSYASFP